MSSPVSARWIVPPRQVELEESLSRELGIRRLTAAALIERGISSAESADSFLNPKLEDLHDPTLLPDYEVAVQLILSAKETGELIYLHGDYDVDGVTSTALLFRFLTLIGCKVHPHVPHRIREGYGIHDDMVEEAIGMGAGLFLTCDCGASALKQIARAREAGLKVVVTDHHHVGPEMPSAHAFVNPHRADSRYPFPDLCGVGVAFKLCQGIAKELKLPVDKFQRAYLDLVALGTVADVMPLVGENRILVRHGLPLLSASQKPGIQALIRAASLQEKAAAGFDTYHVGFGLAPRLNAAGRIDDSVKSLRLLLSQSLEEANPIAAELESLNQQRKDQQNAMVEEALGLVGSTGQTESPLIMVRNDRWHPGIVGIVAGRLKDRFYRPTFVLTLDEGGEFYKGSARSISGFHLAEAIESLGSVASGGGHAKAAGISIPVDRYEEVRALLTARAASVLTEDDLRPVLEATAETTFKEIDLSGAEELRKLEPFGEANRSPVFVVRGATLKSIKPTKNPDHPFPFFSQGGSADLKFTAFGMGKRFDAIAPPTNLDLAFEIGVEEWRGSRSVGWQLKDFASSN